MEQTTFTQKYTQLVDGLHKYPDITQAKKSGFGSGVRANGKVFAMPSKGSLVVKLSPERIEELVKQGKGQPYVMGGRVAKGWFVVANEADWVELAEEALEFVSKE